ncbi:hypothetical protein ACA910_017971 [Epithemia clementina (nom. ined.)]
MGAEAPTTTSHAEHVGETLQGPLSIQKGEDQINSNSNSDKTLVVGRRTSPRRCKESSQTSAVVASPKSREASLKNPFSRFYCDNNNSNGRTLLRAAKKIKLDPTTKTTTKVTTTTTTTKQIDGGTTSKISPPITVTPPRPRRSSRSTSATTPKKIGTRTHSFAPLTDSSIVKAITTTNKGMQRIPPPAHTLILGTHPSISSLKQAQYYAHPMNAFWWIAGDCLGFRRASGISDRSGQTYQFATHLRHDNVLTYAQQQEMLVQHGFVLWDVVASCGHKRSSSSLDQDIVEEVPNNVPRLVEKDCPTIGRIVLANGGQACSFFLKHFLKSWMEPAVIQGRIVFQAATDENSQRQFANVCECLNSLRPRIPKRGTTAKEGTASGKARTIVLVSAVSVSPSAARFSYLEKRDFWETNVYQPGLQDYHRQTQCAQGSTTMTTS